MFIIFFLLFSNKPVCPKNVISNGTSGYLSSPFYPSSYPNDMECSWNITGPVGSRLILSFYRICLGVCTTGQPCQCDRLVINEAFNSRQLCSTSQNVVPFISLENTISLSMLTDGQYTSKGFVAEYHSVFLDGGKRIINNYDSRGGLAFKPGGFLEVSSPYLNCTNCKLLLFRGK